MKKILYIISITLFIFIFSSTVLAEDNVHVFDRTNSFTSNESEALENILDEIENEKYLGFFIVTRAEDDVANEMSITEYSEQFVYDNDIDSNYYGGQILVFDYYNFEYAIYNYGYATNYFSDSDMDILYSELNDNVDNGLYDMSYKYSIEVKSMVQNFSASNISTTDTAVYKGYVTDYANLFSESEESILEESIESIINEYNFDVAILTVNSTNGENIVTFAEDYFVDNDLGIGSTYNGLVYVIDMGDREFRLVTSGEIGQASFTDYGIDQLNANIAEKLSEGNYFQGMEILLSTTRQYIEAANVGNVVDEPFFSTKSILISLGSAFLLAIIILVVKIKGMNNAKIKTLATNYIKPGSFNISRSRDTFLYRNITKTRRQKNKTRSGGGGSFHSGSGGRSFGGGGGHF